MTYLLDAIREGMEASGKSRYRISQDLGITQGHLSRVMSGERGLSLETYEQLADYLGLEIIVRPKRQRRKARP